MRYGGLQEAKARINVLEITRLSKAYGAIPVLNDLNLQVKHGEHLLLLGPSGSGKGTLINLITGPLTPDSDDIRISGEPMTGLAAAARDDLGIRTRGRTFREDSRGPGRHDPFLRAGFAAPCARFRRYAHRNPAHHRNGRAADHRLIVRKLGP